MQYIAYGLLAQVVEHLTFNQVVPRSNRGWLTNSWPRGQAVKTSPFHGGDMGSIPVGVTTKYINATLAQLVEQLTCGIDKIKSYFELSCTFMRKLIKWTPLIRGRLSNYYMLIPS